MNNPTTTQSWDTLDLSTLKKTGAGEYHGPCPVTGEGKDCFWVKPDDRLIGCRSCSPDGGGLDTQQFKEHLGALGLGATFGAHDDLAPYDWTNYLTGEIVTQARPGGEQKYLWPKGAKPGTLVYLARFDRTSDRSLVFCEGAKAATAAASKLPVDDYDVIAFASSSTIPNDATLKALSRGRSCVIWPDDDVPGARVATRLVSALRQAGADEVTVVDPERLGLTGGSGADAEQWHPGGSPGEELRAACGTAQPAPLAHFRSIWTYAAEATPVVLIPGLAWRGRVSKISSAPKLGKTSLLTNGIAAWQAGREFLGEPTGPPGTVLYVSETGIGVLRAWFEQYGCPTDSPILAGGAAAVETIAKSAREHKPDLVVIDSITDLHAASDGGNIWNAGDVRKLIQPLRELGCAVILVHHVRKSDGASRDSGDLEAAPDVNISFDPGFKYGGDTPPPGPRRLRYFGRWDEPDRMLTFDKTDGYALANSTGGGGPEGGGSDPFTVVAPTPTLLDQKVVDYIMQHAASSGRQIRAALGCQLRDLRPSLARLSAAGRIACDTGLRSAKLWSVTTSGSPPATPMFEPVEPVLVHATGSVNVYGVEPDEPVLVQPVQTLVNQTPEPDDLNQTPEPDDLHGGDLPLAGAKTTTPPTPTTPTGGAGEPAKGEDMVNLAKHVGCLACGGSGLDGQGNPCGQDWYMDPHGERQKRGVSPVVHTSGSKKWDDATSTWVDTVPSGDVWNVGLSNGVHLSDGTSVTDGDPRVHWGESWNDIELENEGTVH